MVIQRWLGATYTPQFPLLGVVSMGMGAPPTVTETRLCIGQVLSIIRLFPFPSYVSSYCWIELSVPCPVYSSSHCEKLVIAAWISASSLDPVTTARFFTASTVVRSI